jgi:type VI protein secretion system component VasK
MPSFLRNLAIALLALLLALPGFLTAQEAKVNRHKIEREKKQREKEARKDYQEALKRHHRRQSKETRAMMRHSKKEAKRTLPVDRK